MRAKQSLFRKTRSLVRLTATAAATGFMAAGFAVGPHLLAQSPPVAQASAQRPASVDPYQRWLDEDVRWIVTPAERAAFVELTTDEARDKFIVKFWQLRDASSDGTGNRFREEHYRRLAYANTNFASSVPGWNTDRGRTYILSGPPDSIDSHRVGSVYSNGRPYEVWHYRAKEADIRFVDVCNCGDFRLQTSVIQ